MNISITPVANAPLESPAKATLHIAEVNDQRMSSDPRAVMQKYNAYGKTTGAYVANKPVVELFLEALETALSTNSFKLASNKAYFKLTATIKDAGQDHMQTGLFTVNVVSTLSVRFELLDSASNVVWRDTLTGKAEEKTSTAGASFVERNFKAAVEDVLRQLVEDKLFRKNFQ